MSTYIPVYKRPPNQFINYELRPFSDVIGNKATLRVAIFLDKNKKQQEMVAQVMWRTNANNS